MQQLTSRRSELEGALPATPDELEALIRAVRDGAVPQTLLDALLPTPGRSRWLIGLLLRGDALAAEIPGPAED